MDDSRKSPDRNYGAWKFIHEIELEDLLAHPIWLWCSQLGLPDEDSGPIGGDETSMRPLLTSRQVSPEHVQPLILLRVNGTDLHASGLYDTKDHSLDSISVFADGCAAAPARVPDLPEPTVYVAVPTIDGRQEVRFRSESR